MKTENARQQPKSLADYQRKRDFKQTREPSGGSKSTEAGQAFVIQKHDASRLHYDFRLEIDGVLKSWAVPKGVPLTPDERHLAVEVEDHPLEYGQFEGTIPAGNYGGGTVMLWDFGTYELLGGEPLEAWRSGKLHFTLAGHKLIGEWTLVRTRRDDDKNQWLLLKTGGNSIRLTKKADEHSAVSGRTMRQIADAGDAVWKSSRPARTGLAHRPKTAPSTANKPALPTYIPPMKPVLVSALPDESAEWLYEIKFDGYRALALKRGDQVELWSASHKPLDFPDLAQAVAALPCDEAIVDGEVVALDDKGRSSFQLLQNARSGADAAALRLYAFDLLRLDGEDLRDESTVGRKRRLAALLADQPEDGLIRFSADLTGSPAQIVSAAARLGLEGVVAKQRNAPYRSGRRTPEWQKFKLVHEQEFVIGGYTLPGGSRK